MDNSSTESKSLNYSAVMEEVCLNENVCVMTNG